MASLALWYAARSEETADWLRHPRSFDRQMPTALPLGEGPNFEARVVDWAGMAAVEAPAQTADALAQALDTDGLPSPGRPPSSLGVQLLWPPVHLFSAGEDLRHSAADVQVC
mmetsp:Transcript_39399/g.108555  ORF Transcript_39399/g.108555 Transcript_39399/m.108555 type:complete len:112 (+) Transcript_39399:551-886(+)